MSGTDPRTVKAPQDANTSAAYPAQMDEKSRREKAEAVKSRICVLTLSHTCTTKYTIGNENCSLAERVCRKNAPYDVDASCTMQQCEIEKAACLVENAQMYQTCMQAVAP